MAHNAIITRINQEYVTDYGTPFSEDGTFAVAFRTISFAGGLSFACTESTLLSSLSWHQSLSMDFIHTVPDSLPSYALDPAADRQENHSVNFEVVRGRTYTRSVTIKNKETGEAYALTSGVFRLTAKWSLSDADGSAAFQLTSEEGAIVILDASAGQLAFTIPAVDTASLPNRESLPITLHYDLTWINSTGAYSVLSGRITVLPNVTNTYTA